MLNKYNKSIIAASLDKFNKLIIAAFLTKFKLKLKTFI
jgi:hypothetical protein